MTETTKDIDHAERGQIVWHSSEEDGGPDVGLSLGLGDGVTLYVGDISRRAYDDAGAPLADCGGDGGWWLNLYRPGGAELIGKVLGQEEGRALIDVLFAALQAGHPTAPSPCQGEEVATALANASRFVRAFAENETDAELYASATECERQIDAALTALRSSPQGATDTGWRPIETAPKDGRMLRLKIEHYDEAAAGAYEANPTDDVAPGEHWYTIGWNNHDNTEEDEWQFAGWCWSHDHWTEGKGKVVGWKPYDDAPVSSPPPAGAAQ